MGRQSEGRLDAPKSRVVAENGARLENETSCRGQYIDFSVEGYVQGCRQRIAGLRALTMPRQLHEEKRIAVRQIDRPIHQPRLLSGDVRAKVLCEDGSARGLSPRWEGHAT